MGPEVTTQEDQADELERFEAEFNETAPEPRLDDEADGANQAVAGEGDEAEPTGQPEPVEAPEADLYSVPDHEKFGEYRGKKLTAAQLEEAGLLKKFVTWEHQSLDAERIYTKNKELQEQLKQLEEKVTQFTAPKEPAAADEPPPELSPDEVKQLVGALENRYVGRYQQAAQNGGIEPEMVEYYPKFLSVQEHRFQMGQAQLSLHNEIIQALAEDYVTRHRGEETRTGADHLNGLMDRVAGREEFSPFTTEELRGAFVKWFATEENGRSYDKLPVQMVNEKIMEDAFMAFMRDRPDLFSSQPTQAPESKRKTGNRHLATGGGTSSGGPGGARSGNKFSEFESEFLGATNNG